MSATSLAVNTSVSKLPTNTQRWTDSDTQWRIEKIRVLRSIIQSEAQELAQVLSEECHRPLVESLSQEILPVLEMAKYCERNYARWLSAQSRPYRRPCFRRKNNVLTREPLGCLAVFSPRNFPFSLGMMTLIFAALAGNTVVLKPSEHSQHVPDLIERLLTDSGLKEAGAARVVRGGIETGRKLIEHPSIDKVFFFGHPESAMDIARTCLKNGKPFVLESGGGSTAFVLEDADLKLAAKGLAWSVFYANGQSCVSTERIVVDRSVEKEFLRLFKKYAQIHLDDRQANFSGDVYSEADQSRYRELIKIAKKEGATVSWLEYKTNGQKRQPSCLPFIISNTSDATELWQKDIFGPIVVLTSVDDVSQAATQLNNQVDSLGISIWSRSNEKAAALARSILSGMIWINDTSFGMPHLPWGGWRKTDRGSLFSEYSLHEVTRLKWISLHPSRWAKPRFWWPPYTRLKEKILLATVRFFR